MLNIPNRNCETWLTQTTIIFQTTLPSCATSGAHTNALGAIISDANFKTIILNFLPYSWDPTVTVLYENQTSTKAISQLQVW